MPFLDDLDLTAADFRQHYDLTQPLAQEPHWLLTTVYGRDLLKMKLRQVNPHMRVPEWAYSKELDPLLEQMVDKLSLRDLPKPRTLRQKMLYVEAALLSMVAIRHRKELPDWNYAKAVGIKINF
ncbi:hypothetical protein H6G33_38285 [Calothrix sp. FACHB-1219]|uniref:hypothetical protein n=1 Tax=Calothrix sp. FACHB-1219 TaxID=2692778 RepID=UPI0016838279|nr:hypothetical protein [Calothrix sp. FACHB-1219]MBD2222766.1 hypothetical protein [Calothrix sp. FACHB-1219]